MLKLTIEKEKQDLLYENILTENHRKTFQVSVMM